MLEINYKAPLRGVNKVTINSIDDTKTNSKGAYIDILVTKDGKQHHILNNINSNTEKYIIAQLYNLATQLGLPDCNRTELFELVKGREAEIEILENGFHINSYTVLTDTEEEPEI